MSEQWVEIKPMEKWAMLVKADGLPAQLEPAYLCTVKGILVASTERVELLNRAEAMLCGPAICVRVDGASLLVVPVDRVIYMTPVEVAT